MANILSELYESRPVQTVVKDAEGVEHTVEQEAKVLSQVTFKLPDGTPHTLTFLPKGTVLKYEDDVQRVMGDAQTVVHEFTSGVDAVEAYFAGKV